MAFLTGSKIDEFCTKGLPIWVKNKTGTVLLIEMPSGGGQTVPLRISSGQEPFCISDYFPPNMIRDAAVLRRLISDGKIVLFDPEDPKVKGKRSAAPMTGIAGTGMSAAERAERHGVAQQDVGEALDPDLEEVEASPKVSVLCDAITQGDMKSEQFFEKIGEIEARDGLTEVDISYIISELKENQDIVDWATNRLADAREAVENDDDEEEELEEGVSSGTQADLEESAKELIARSRTQNNSVTDDPSKTAKVEHATMSPKERKVFRGNLK
jgi:hypothetical protein